MGQAVVQPSPFKIDISVYLSIRFHKYEFVTLVKKYYPPPFKVDFSLHPSVRLSKCSPFKMDVSVYPLIHSHKYEFVTLVYKYYIPSPFKVPVLINTNLLQLWHWLKSITSPSPSKWILAPIHQYVSGFQRLSIITLP